MAEVIATFGALSSFIQLLDFGVKVTRHAHKILSTDVDDDSYDLGTTKLVKEYQSLAGPPDKSIEDKQIQTAESIVRVQQQLQDEAQQLLKQLLALRVAPETKGVRRFTEGARKAFRSVNERKKLEQRRSQLQELNGILATHLLQSLASKHEIQVAAALSQLQENTAHADSRKSESTNADNLLLLAKAQKGGVKERNERLLGSLWFEGMSERQSAILDAYPDTYKWALESDSLGFRTWLQDKGGLFWVCGKAGSGKSTLMKFLCGSTEMHELLQQWSGTDPLVFANFYFWYTGKAIQKSLNGLLRGLLYQIFTARLDLAPIAFPSYYDDIIPLKPLLGQSLSDGELLQALENIAQHDGNDTKCTKFCFFIDGLDEYSGDHLGLVRVLHRLAKNADFKLCVSSRPWNAFRNAFETSVPNLQLENLTHDDIQHYVRESLREAYASVSFATEDALNDLDFTDDAEALIEDIVKGAEGVFLWVYLVVRSVIRGIAEGDDIDFLRHRVQSFPSDLDEFFRNILVRVDAEYKAQSSQALYLAYLGVSASWIDFWLIRQSPKGLSSPEFAYEFAIEGLSLQRLEKRVNETRTFLSAVC